MKFSRTKLIIFGFIAIILVGTLLLCLPCATKAGEETTFLGALLTATSATCVTGLVAYDTWTHWTIFGQLVILTLIQIGGLGFITLGVFTLVLLRRRIGLNSRELIHDSLSTMNLQGGVKLVRRIIFATLFFEGVGAILLALRFSGEMGLIKGLYYGIFHSISAFCNAGFDLMGFREEYSSFTYYVADPWVNIVLVALIIIGGIGFLVWEDLWANHLHWKKYRFQTKLVLFTTLVLTVGGTLLFLIAERDNLFADMDAGATFFAALFSAVTPRTAGFNSVDTAGLTNAGLLLTILLMFIGGSPGSTAGGIKTTTCAVIFLYIRAYLLRQKDCTAFKHRLDESAIRRASVVVFVNFLLAFFGGLAILLFQELPLRDVLFEVFSAIGTAGMSTGVTRELCSASQLVIILLMFCGRVGSLTFAMSFTERRHTDKIRYPEGKVIVG